MVDKVPCVSTDYWALLDWNWRLAKQCWKMFHTTYNVFLDLMKLEAERWWQEWLNKENRCCARKLVPSLDLKILGALLNLAHGVSHVICSTCSNLSKELHRCFLHKWICNMVSTKNKFIFHALTPTFSTRYVCSMKPIWRSKFVHQIALSLPL